MKLPIWACATVVQTYSHLDIAEAFWYVYDTYLCCLSKLQSYYINKDDACTSVQIVQVLA